METKKAKHVSEEERRERLLRAIEKGMTVEKERTSGIIQMDEILGIDGVTITVKEAQTKYKLSAYSVNRIAQKMNAIIYIGDGKFILGARLKEYLSEMERKKK